MYRKKIGTRVLLALDQHRSLTNFNRWEKEMGLSFEIKLSVRMIDIAAAYIA